jgi:hypothetical protein
MTDSGGTDIEQDEVLWIGPETCHLPEMPDGFALRVVDFLGPGGVDSRLVRLVWVRGPVLGVRGGPRKVLQLCVPVDQRRAVLVGQHSGAPAARQHVTGPDGRRYRRVDFSAPT